MLVLSRFFNERVQITSPDGTVVVVTVVGLGPCKVRLGFDAPQSLVIDRLPPAAAESAASSANAMEGTSACPKP